MEAVAPTEAESYKAALRDIPGRAGRVLQYFKGIERDVLAPAAFAVAPTTIGRGFDPNRLRDAIEEMRALDASLAGLRSLNATMLEKLRGQAKEVSVAMGASRPKRWWQFWK